jgi:hypothetical protein
MEDILFLVVDEEVGIAKVVAVVTEALYLTQRRANAIEGIKNADLGEETESHGEQDKIGSGIDDNVWSAFEEDKVDPCSKQGIGCCEAYWAAADNDDFEAV